MNDDDDDDDISCDDGDDDNGPMKRVIELTGEPPTLANTLDMLACSVHIAIRGIAKSNSHIGWHKGYLNCHLEFDKETMRVRVLHDEQWSTYEIQITETIDSPLIPRKPDRNVRSELLIEMINHELDLVIQDFMWQQDDDDNDDRIGCDLEFGGNVLRIKFTCTDGKTERYVKLVKVDNDLEK